MRSRRWHYSPAREQKFRCFWNWVFVILFAFSAVIAITITYTVVHFALKFW